MAQTAYSATNSQASDDNTEVLNCIREAKREADEAKLTRKRKNRQNWQSYMGQQDWSHKQAGQSREFLPKTPVAVEQFSAFIKKGLVAYGDWFSVDVPPDSMLRDYEVRELMKVFLDYLADGMRGMSSFALRVSDACKISLLEAVMTFKVHGYKIPEKVYMTERGPNRATLRQKVIRPWRLAIDIVRADDYFPDPTGRKLYEIHRVERDFHDVVELANQGLYDKNVLNDISDDFDDREKEYQDQLTRNQQGIVPPPFRKTVVIDEYWGDLLDKDGNLTARNILCAMANERYLLREPEPNPNWHGESPFVSFPLIRVPDTVWHKALFDHASPLNMALNELFNLMLDGGLASVWGIKQLRAGWLEDPRQVANGVPQGITLVCKDDMPMGEKIMEQVATGAAPPDALAMFQLADREFNSAAVTNELKLGNLPAKQVRSTEIIEIQQSQAVTLDGITGDMEWGIQRILEKAWLCMLQNADSLDASDVVAAIGSRAALTLSRMAPAERFAAFARGFSFKAHGLSSTIARTRDFQKFAALQTLIQQNPMLMEAFMRRYSADKSLDHMLKALNINPDHLGLEPAEAAAAPQRMQRMQQLSQMFGVGAPGTTKQTAMGQESQIPAEVSQMTNPLTGMQ